MVKGSKTKINPPEVKDFNSRPFNECYFVKDIDETAWNINPELAANPHDLAYMEIQLNHLRNDYVIRKCIKDEPFEIKGNTLVSMSDIDRQLKSVLSGVNLIMDNEEVGSIEFYKRAIQNVLFATHNR